MKYITIAVLILSFSGCGSNSDAAGKAPTNSKYWDNDTPFTIIKCNKSLLVAKGGVAEINPDTLELTILADDVYTYDSCSFIVESHKLVSN